MVRSLSLMSCLMKVWQLANAVSTIVARCGEIGIVVNNTGIGSTGPLAEFPLEVIRKASGLGVGRSRHSDS
ncbi:hypothetical protein FRX31_009070 [Thalictrum thalictroides]|uniref:Uncharacterized protein n=1 Tax=Thalictrum thalictroides TaxID=46969 RepID=A0A7J6WVB6_THATH|nr:hypothetical protein FRX31_009070 [Thalictrum thalictroides]